MKTNLVATITSLIGDMHESGEFVEIIEGEVFNHLESKISHINALAFGVCADGSVDTTHELKNAIERACILGQPTIIQGFDLRLTTENIDFGDGQCVELETDKTLKTALHKFKKNFGGKYIEFIGEFDYIQKPFINFLYNSRNGGFYLGKKDENDNL